MHKERITQLEKMYKENPQDSFLVYALALEYKNQDKKKAEILFDTLLSTFPEYLPTYYHAAGFYNEQGDVQKAKNCYEKGILLAKKQEENHALKELKNAFQNFIIELD